jgi:hypothetical protein
LKASQLEEALNFCKRTVEQSCFQQSPLLLTWYGKVLAYSGNEAQGRTVLKRALDIDSENEEIKKCIRNIRKSSDCKEEAS